MKKLLLLIWLLIPIVSFAQSTKDTSFCGYSRTSHAPFTAVSNTTYDALAIDAGGANVNGINIPSNSHDITVKHCIITNSHAATGAIHIGENCTNILIEYNFISYSYRGVNPTSNSGNPPQVPGSNIKIVYNRFYNIADAAGHPNGAGSSVQFNNIVGPGLVCSHNDVLTDISSNTVGDVLNFFQSSGTALSPMHLDSNCVQGGSLDPTGKSGFILGDVGGSNQTATGNKCYNSGMQGFQIQGGTNITATANFVYGNGVGVALVGITYGNYSGKPSTGITESNNKITWKNSSGGSFFAKWWDTSNGTTQPTGWTTNTADNGSDPSVTAALLPVPLFSTSCAITPPSPPVIAYSPNTKVYTVGSAITVYTPTNTGGAATTWTVTPALPGGLVISASTGSITGTPTAVRAAATYSVTASNTGGSGSTNITITVNPAPINVPIIDYPNNDPTYIYKTAISANIPINTGAAATSWAIAPALPAGLSFNTSTGVITGTPTAAGPTVAYTVTATNANGNDKTVVNITIAKVNLVVTAGSFSKAYGAAMPTLTVSYSGFASGDNAGSLTVAPVATTTATSASNVGVYIITPAGGVSTNYSFIYVPGTLTITTVGLTITPNATSRLYGDVNPVFTVTYTGFVNGDNSSKLLTLPIIISSAVQASNVGTYTIVASGASSLNYVMTYGSPAAFTINKAPLNIYANSATKVVGAVNPALSYYFTGFKLGQTQAVLTAQPTISTTAVTGSPAGTYPITVASATATNYAITFHAGTLTVSAPASGGSKKHWHRKIKY